MCNDPDCLCYDGEVYEENDNLRSENDRLQKERDKLWNLCRNVYGDDKYIYAALGEEEPR